MGGGADTIRVPAAISRRNCLTSGDLAVVGGAQRGIGRNVRYWHKADIGLRGLNVSFGGPAFLTGHSKNCPRTLSQMQQLWSDQQSTTE